MRLRQFISLGRTLAVAILVAATSFAQDVRLEKPREWRQPGTPPVFTGAVTFAFWNIEWFPGGPNRREYLPTSYIPNQTAAVAEIIDAEDPVILIASEVRSLADALALNRALKHPYPFVAVTDYGDVNGDGEGKFNLQEHALFSRVPWDETWELDFGSLATAPNRPPRGAIGAVFRLGTNSLTIYGMHPKANYISDTDKNRELTALRNVEKRERATVLLLDDLRRRNLAPLQDKIIIAGDFNTDLYAERFQGEKTVRAILQAGFFNSFEGLAPADRVTIPAQKDDLGRSYPDTTFDYILSSVGLGQLKAMVVQRGFNKEKPGSPGKPGHASDHYMVKVALPASP